MKHILHILKATVAGPYQLRVEFNTGETKTVNLKPLLKGPVFMPLRDVEFFNRVSVDPECQTVVWPNGADLAPEALYELEEGVSEPKVKDIEISNSELIVHLRDNRRISAPLDWYPRLKHGRKAEREHYELIGSGQGIHWPDLDEDLSVEGILAGRRSMESPRSFQRWLERRREARRR